MIYQLYRGIDRRDNTEALWLIRGDEDIAYLGKVPPAKEVGKHAARIKQVTFAKPNYYVFEGPYAWVMHCKFESRYLVDQWEV